MRVVREEKAFGVASQAELRYGMCGGRSTTAQDKELERHK